MLIRALGGLVNKLAVKTLAPIRAVVFRLPTRVQSFVLLLLDARDGKDECFYK